MAKLFGNRVGAGTYLLAMSLAVNAWCLAMMALHAYAFVPQRIDRQYEAYVLGAAGAPVGYLFFRLSRARLHDLNCPGHFVNILAFPFLGVIFLPVLCFLSGQRYENQFGVHPEPSGALKLVAALMSFAAALVLVPYVTQLYGQG